MRKSLRKDFLTNIFFFYLNNNWYIYLYLISISEFKEVEFISDEEEFFIQIKFKSKNLYKLCLINHLKYHSKPAK